MRILIVGVGAMGGFLAGKLLHQKKDVTLLVGRKSTKKFLLEHGLSVRADEGEVWVRPQKIFSDAADLALAKERFDSIWLLTKATVLSELVPKLLPLLDDKGHFVCFQNGMVESEVQKHAGKGRVLAATLAWGATLLSTGRVQRTSPGITYVGELEGGLSSRAAQIAAILSLATEAVQCENMRGILWSKLAVNCTITTLGALTGETLGELLKNTFARRAFLDLYREVIDVALACGVKLESIAAPPKLLYLPRGAGALRRRGVDLLLQSVAFRHRNTRASMLQSLQRGEKTEIDFLNAYVVNEAQKTGVDAIVNARLVLFIKEIECGSRFIGQKTLNDFLGLHALQRRKS